MPRWSESPWSVELYCFQPHNLSKFSWEKSFVLPFITWKFTFRSIFWQVLDFYAFYANLKTNFDRRRWSCFAQNEETNWMWNYEPQKAREKFKSLDLVWVSHTWLEPAIQSKASTWSAVNFKKTADLDEVLTWARDMVTWHWSADTLFWQVSIGYKMDVQYQRLTL